MSGESQKPAASSPFDKLSQFKPKGAAAQQIQDAIASEAGKAIDEVATKNGFLSREARPTPPQKKRRFGDAVPKKQLNIRVPEALHDRYYRISEEQGYTELCSLLEAALDAYEEKKKANDDST